jgi:hypothetical protein
MNTLVRHSVSINRVILTTAALLFSAIAIKYMVDPVGAVAPHHIALGSREAVTVMRVSGSVFLAIAIALVASLSKRRLLAGSSLLAIVATVVTVVRLFGLAMDGAAPFTLMVLKPEIALVVASYLGVFVEWRRLQGPRADAAPAGAIFVATGARP